MGPTLPLDQGSVGGSGKPSAEVPPAGVHHPGPKGGGGKCNAPVYDALLGDHLRLKLAAAGPLHDA
eukprot:2807696-Lingulodinium_polyedra.AAC.1